MLEIIILASIYGALVPVAKKKNRNKWLPVLGPALWLVGKFSAAYLSAIVLAILGSDPESQTLIIYAASLIGAIAGAGVAFLVIQFLPTKNLVCPKCSHKFVNNSDWGVSCKGCGSKLRVANDKVSIIETAE